MIRKFSPDAEIDWLLPTFQVNHISKLLHTIDFASEYFSYTIHLYFSFIFILQNSLIVLRVILHYRKCYERIAYFTFAMLLLLLVLDATHDFRCVLYTIIINEWWFFSKHRQFIRNGINVNLKRNGSPNINTQSKVTSITEH